MLSQKVITQNLTVASIKTCNDSLVDPQNLICKVYFGEISLNILAYQLYGIDLSEVRSYTVS